MEYFWLIIIVISFYLIAHNVLFVGYLWCLKAVGGSSKQSKERGAITKMSLIMPLFNEEEHIIGKLENIHAGVKAVDADLEVLIGSDGSTDKTCTLVREYIGEHGLLNWHLYEFENEGKGQTINKLVQVAKGDLIISTDADTRMDADAINVIVEAFQVDRRLGCLSCIPEFHSKKMGAQALYWDFELFLRDLESRLGKLIVVTGWLYAYRKECFKPIPVGAMADDLWVPISILLQGFRSEHRKSLKCLSEKTDEALEVSRRMRVMSGGMDIVKRLSSDIHTNPLLWFIVFSHKVNRWLLPVWITLFAVSLVFISVNFLYVYAGFTAVLIVVLKPKRFGYLLASLFSAFISVVKAFSGKDLSKWEHTRVN